MPALTIGVLAFSPGMVLLKNMFFMIPAVAYSAVVIPWWHHSPYRLEAWAARMISGWAHFFAHWDKLRGTEMSWKPSGAQGKGIRSGRFWTGCLVWSAGSCLVWTVLAFWRMVTMNPMDFVTLFALGLVEVAVTVRVILQPTEFAGLT